MDPITIAYLAQAGIGIYQAAAGASAKKEAESRERLLLAQGLPTMQTPQEYYDLYKKASSTKALDREMAMSQSILASNLAALERGGSRALIGGAPAAVIQADRRAAAASERQELREMQALQQLAAAEQRTGAYNFQAQTAQYARDLSAAREGYQAGMETMMGGIETAVGAGLMAADSMGGAKSLSGDGIDPNSGGYYVRGTDNEVSVKPGFEDQYSKTSYTPYSAPFKESELYANQAVTPSFLAPQRSTITYPQTGMGGQPSAFGSPVPFSTDYTPGFQRVDQYSPLPYTGEYMYRQPYQGPRAYGGSYTTPGKYTADHSNEYDVVTKDGKLLATVTGDETLVFTPNQRKFLKPFMKKLLAGKTIKPSMKDRREANKTLKAFKG